MKKRILSSILAVLCCICLAGCIQPVEKTPKLPEIKHPGFYNIKNSFVVSDENNIYRGNCHSIYKALSDTMEFECIYSDESLYINKIALSSDRIYFSSVEKLYSIDKYGKNLTVVADMTSSACKILWDTFYVLEGKVYLKKGSKLSIISEETTAEPGALYENIYINSRGMEYEFVQRSEKTDGTLMVKATDNTIPSEGTITNDASFIFTDDYIFYITGKETDFSCSLSLYRCRPDGSGQQKIAESDKPLKLVYRDNENVYFHNYEKFFILNQKSEEITETAVNYHWGNVYEVCSGRLFIVYTLKPFMIDFATGESTPLPV